MIVLIYGFLGLLTENKSMNSYEFSCGRFTIDNHAFNYLGKQIGLCKQVVTLTTLPDKTNSKPFAIFKHTWTLPGEGPRSSKLLIYQGFNQRHKMIFDTTINFWPYLDMFWPSIGKGIGVVKKFL